MAAFDGVKWLFFDVGYTLVDESAVWERRCREQAETEEAKRLGLSARDIYRAILEASAAYQPQFQTVVKRYGFTEVAPYRHELERLYEQVPGMLTVLAERYRVGVVANQAAGLEARLESWGVRRHISLIVSSWECGAAKPDPAIFREAVRRAGCRPWEAVMIGDRLDNDVFPAKAVGMRTVWVRQGFGGAQTPVDGRYSADETVNTLGDLAALFMDQTR